MTSFDALAIVCVALVLALVYMVLAHIELRVQYDALRADLDDADRCLKATAEGRLAIPQPRRTPAHNRRHDD